MLSFVRLALCSHIALEIAFRALTHPSAMFAMMPSFYSTLGISSCAFTSWAMHWSGWLPSDHNHVTLTLRTSETSDGDVKVFSPHSCGEC